MSHETVRTAPSSENQRTNVRRKLRLAATASSATDSTEMVILDLSETGLLVETSAELDIDAEFEVRIPGQPVIRAVVVWACGNLCGCEFAQPISQAAVSASLLRSPAKAPPLPEPLPFEAAAQRIFKPNDNDFDNSADRWPIRNRFAFLLGLVILSWAFVGAIVAMAL